MLRFFRLKALTRSFHLLGCYSIHASRICCKLFVYVKLQLLFDFSFCYVSLASIRVCSLAPAEQRLLRSMH